MIVPLLEIQVSDRSTSPRHRANTRWRFAAVLLAFALVAFGAVDVRTAKANSPVETFSVSSSATQAGGHPNIHLSFTDSAYPSNNPPGGCACGSPKDLTINFPTGVVGDPHSTPQCEISDFGDQECPIDSQIGVVNVDAGAFPEIPVFNLVPNPTQAGLIGFDIPLVNYPIFAALEPRTNSDYGLSSFTTGIEQAIPLSALEMTLWGVPASPANNLERYGPVGCLPVYLGQRPLCTGGYSSNSEEEPYLDNPTSCGVPLSASIELIDYDGGSSSAEAPYPATTGCKLLSFNPSLYAATTTNQTDSPSGLEVNLQVPQFESPSVPSPSEIRSSTVTLPEGVSINPSAADGKEACTDLEARFGTLEQSECPESSKVGSLSLTSGALPGSLPGYIYIGEPKAGDRYRLIFAANGFGIHVKLAGSVYPDPRTGQLTVSFENLPQTPFSNFNLHFFGAERGLLATSTHCGTYPVTSTFTPWDTSLSEQASTQYFTLDSGPGGTECPGQIRPFAPSFRAGAESSAGGAHAPFALELSRPDGAQNLGGLTVVTPPGLLATLKGIPYCPSAALAQAAEASYSGLAELANPSCPAASQIGTSTVGAGAGDHPVYIPGKVYLAGPYRGAPLSLAVVTPALSGPYDLGNVVVRAALDVNPETAQITAVSDPLPQILQGIPLRLRFVRINLDRQNFTLNPTNCNPASIAAHLTGDQGAVANLSEPFQVANCRNLTFAPKLAMGFTGSTKQAGNPAVHADISYPSSGSYANISRAVVTLPPTDLIDNAHINTPCTEVQFAAGKVPGENCPPGSDIGFAKATTPLLEKPLEGPVYLRTHPGVGLPNLVAALNGQIDIALVGKVDTVHGRIRTTFESVPDAPVSNFSLTLDGGGKGLLENKPGFCARALRVSAEITGQNGKTANQNPLLSTPCAKRHHKRKDHRPARVHQNRSTRR